MTEQPPSELRAKALREWEAHVARLRETVSRLSEEELSVGVAGEAWTVAQILYHAAAGLTYPRDLHQIALTTREATSADMRIYDPPVDELPSREELLALIDQRVAATRAYVAALAEDAFFAVTPVTMPSGRQVDVSLPAVLQSSIDHLREHLEQVQEWLARGRPVERRLLT
ncbi:MAG: DinB family protein [Chloroflexota bacterium]|nr:DinB family protein [Dehalococcoidia bacterium]MDW8253444.1 DinB family protein [Chloroflexota bacterium]